MEKISKNLWVFISFMVLIIAIIILTVLLLKNEPDIYIYVSNERDTLYDLLHNQYTNLLTTIGIFVAVFTIAIPFYHRQMLKDEISELKEIKNDFPKIKEDMPKIKNQLNNYKEFAFALQEIFMDKLKQAIQVYNTATSHLDMYLSEHPQNNTIQTIYHQKVVESIKEVYRFVSNLFYLCVLGENRQFFNNCFEDCENLINDIHEYPYYDKLLPSLIKLYENNNDILSRNDVKKFLGEDSEEYKKYHNLFSKVFKEFDKQKNITKEKSRCENE